MALSRKVYNTRGLRNTLFPEPVVAQRAPGNNDKYEIGQSWIDVPNQDAYTLTAYVSGNPVWVKSGAAEGDFTELEVTPGFFTYNGIGSAFTMTSDTASSIGVTGAVDLDITTATGALNLGANAAVHTVTLGSTTGASATTIQSGTGPMTFTVGGELAIDTPAGITLTSSEAAADAIFLHASNAAGGITLSAGTEGLSLGNDVDITSITLGNGANNVAQTVSIASGVSAANSTVNILSGGGTGTRTVNIGSGTTTNTNINGQLLINNDVNSETYINTGTSTADVYIGNNASSSSDLRVLSGGIIYLGSNPTPSTGTGNIILRANNSISIGQSNTVGGITMTNASDDGIAIEALPGPITNTGLQLLGGDNTITLADDTDLPITSGGNSIVLSTEAAGESVRLTQENGTANILVGNVDPSAGGGVAAPQGSLYLRVNGGAGTTLWVKFGAAATNWEAPTV